MTDQELKDLVASLAEDTKELKALQKETERQMKESSVRVDAQMQETDRVINALNQETREQMQETDRKLKSVGIQLGNIGNNQGEVAEEFFYNSIKAKPTLAGITYDFVDKNVTRSKGQLEDEYDILLVNGKDVAIIETKYKAHPKDLERLLKQKHQNFLKLYPEYKDYNHHLGLASFNISDTIKELASNNNVILLQRKGDVFETILPK